MPLRIESEGKQDHNWSTQRSWKITNPNRRNKLSEPVAYKLVPGGAIPAMPDAASPVFHRAQILAHTLCFTPFSADERWPLREFVNQSAEDEGLPPC